MKTGPDGIDVMHYFEQCKLRAYPDSGSPLAVAIRRNLPTKGLSGAPWTIGYGDTGPDVVEGLVISQIDADIRFAKRLAQEFEPGVERMLRRTPTQRQFDALVSLSYNEGLHAIGNSTLIHLFNEGNVNAASAQFMVWIMDEGKESLGLKRRRTAERSVFDGSTGAFAIALGAAVK